MSANVFLENPWRWRGISDWNDAPGYGIAEHLFLAQCKKNNTRDPQELCSFFFLIFKCPLTARPAVESHFFFLIATFLYQLSNNPCSSVLACKGSSRCNRWSWGLTIKKQFLQNPEGGGRRSDIWKAVWLDDRRVFMFQGWPVVVRVLPDQNWELGYIYGLSIFITCL